MKRILFPIIALLFIFSSCWTMNAASGPPGPPKEQFTGTWTLTGVTFSGIVESDVKMAFDQTLPKDFTNSTWQLNTNGDGSYTLANGIAQNINWSVNSGDALGKQFQFNKVNKNDNANNPPLSYQLVISGNTATSITLKSLVFLGNKNGYVVYTFTKKP